MTISLLSAQYGLPYLENFDSGNSWALPEGWNTSKMNVSDYYVSGDNIYHLQGTISDWFGAISATSAVIGPITDGSFLSFDFNCYDFASYDEIALGSNTIKVSIDENIIYTIDDTINKPGSGWQKVIIPLNDYKNKTIRVHWESVWREGDISIVLDNIAITGEPYDNDLIALSILNPKSNMVDEVSELMVNIRNHGKLTTADYSIKLMQLTENEPITLESISGISINHGQSHSFTIPWIPKNDGNFKIYGFVDFEREEFDLNNQTNEIDVIVLPKGTSSAFVGDINGNVFSNHFPITYHYVHQITQIIYLENEIKTTGNISYISYFFTRFYYSEIPTDLPISIYMAKTDKKYFKHESDWNQYNEFTKVYHGIPNVSNTGSYEMLIKLDTPFKYEDKNLVIMTVREGINDEYYSGYYWQGADHSAFRSICYYSDSDMPALNNIPSGNTSEFLPNITLYFSNDTSDESDVTLPLPTNNLLQNYPNPFNPETTIQFGVASNVELNSQSSSNGFQRVTIDIFNIKGQRVRTLVNGEYVPGKHSVVWNGRDDNGVSVGSGIYFYRMNTAGFSATKKMVLIK